MDGLFENSYSYEEYKNVLKEPLEADRKQNKNYFDWNSSNEEKGLWEHYQKCYAITEKQIKLIEKRIIIIDLICCLYFIYVDAKSDSFDNKYWFFIGKLKNGVYFLYESKCDGTGFGFSEESYLYLAREPDLLVKFGLTNKQRDLINKHKKYIF